MIPASITFKTFGIPMQRQSVRRKLVVYTYLALLLICCLTIWVGRVVPGAISYAIYSALAVGIFVFGGVGRYGLIKAFANKPPRPDSPTIDVIKLHLNPMSVCTPETSVWKNDERELSRRDLAHYRAYPVITVPILFILLLSSWALHPLHRMSVPLLLDLTFAIALVATILSLTLPSAIILWTEPDIEIP